MPERDGVENEIKPPTMQERLGNLLYWLATGISALAAFWLIFGIISGPGDYGWGAHLTFAIFAVVVWGVGRVARYVLAGR